MSKYKTVTAQKEQAKKVRVSELVACEVCGDACAVCGSGTDIEGFTVAVGVCDDCAFWCDGIHLEIIEGTYSA